jgi:hypothetical protein
MHQYIPPTIEKAARLDENPHAWLCDRFADQRWDSDTGNDGYFDLIMQAEGLPSDVLIQAITDSAIERGSTTNGGHEVYLDGWVSLPWCTEDELLTWWA